MHLRLCALFYYYKLGILLLLLFTYLTSYSSANENNDQTLSFGTQYEEFDWNLLKALESPNYGNVLISPLSIKMVLAMLYEGSAGITRNEIERLLSFSSKEQEVRENFQQVFSVLKRPSIDYRLDFGTRVYLDKNILPQQRFASVLKNFYDADILLADFNNTADTRSQINYWVSNITHGHIRDLVSESDIEDANLLIASALYYKGLWRAPFLRNNTEMKGFHITPQQTVQVPYMFNYASYYYTESNELDAKILRLPYKDSHISMYILLPNSKTGLSTLIRDLSPQILRRQVSLMDIHDVHVYLPKFTFNFHAKLGRILQKLGLQQIFQNTASLPGIARGKGVTKRLMVSNIFQKAGIDVNEEGTTVFAATEISLTNKFGTRDVIFNVSSPFLFFIEEGFTGNVLFVGKVENPAQTTGILLNDDADQNIPDRFRPATSSADFGVDNSSILQLQAQQQHHQQVEPSSHGAAPGMQNLLNSSSTTTGRDNLN